MLVTQEHLKENIVLYFAAIVQISLFVMELNLVQSFVLLEKVHAYKLFNIRNSPIFN